MKKVLARVCERGFTMIFGFSPRFGDGAELLAGRWWSRPKANAEQERQGLRKWQGPPVRAGRCQGAARDVGRAA